MRERLVAIRTRYQMSQREFSGRLGMTQSTYAPLETGKRDIRDAYVKLICKTYGVSESWFRTGKGDMLTDMTDSELGKLLSIYDTLTPALRKSLLRQAKELQVLQEEIY